MHGVGNKDPRGFSLPELVVLVGTLASLVAVFWPRSAGYPTRSTHQEVLLEFRRIEGALEGYLEDVGDLSPLNDIAPFGTGTEDPTILHFMTGDGQEGWDGPYLTQITIESSLGGSFDVDVVGPRQATIDLGPQRDLAENFDDLLTVLNGILDGDEDLERGKVWGDHNGVHYGFRYERP